MVLLGIAIGVYALVFITIPLIVIFHELGHAFAYLMLTKPEKIDIYIGSYGDSKKSINFKISRFNFYVKRSFLFIKWVGLCKSSKTESNYLKYIVILLAGPMFTMLVAVLAGVVIFNSDIHGFIKLYCFAFIIFSAISLYQNLLPGKLSKGNNNFASDGEQILLALKLKHQFPLYFESITDFRRGDYEKAAPKLRAVFEKIPYDGNLLRMLVDSLSQIKKYDDALFYLSDLEFRFGLTAAELLTKGCLLSGKKNHEEAISAYRLVLKNDTNNLTALNNLGYELRETGELAEAAELLNKAIIIDPEFDHAYGNLGFIKVLKGDLEAGKELIDKSLALNNENAFAYKYLGIYYLKTGNILLANFNFNKVKELDSTIDIDLNEDEANALNEAKP